MVDRMRTSSRIFKRKKHAFLSVFMLTETAKYEMLNSSTEMLFGWGRTETSEWSEQRKSNNGIRSICLRNVCVCVLCDRSTTRISWSPSSSQVKSMRKNATKSWNFVGCFLLCEIDCIANLCGWFQYYRRYDAKWKTFVYATFTSATFFFSLVHSQLCDSRAFSLHFTSNTRIVVMYHHRPKEHCFFFFMMTSKK